MILLLKSKVNVVLLLMFSLFIIPLSSLEAGSRDNFLKGMGGDFTLTNQEGKQVSLKDYRGKAVLMFFGYISCPDVCPATLVNLRSVLGLLGGKAENVRVLFVTIDPERDKPKIMKRYMETFDSGFIGLTGTQAEIEKVAKQYKVGYKKVETKSAMGYMMDHSTYIYLINPNGELENIMSKKTNKRLMAQSIKDVL